MSEKKEVVVKGNNLPTRIQGLDSIRLFLALWVVFSHFGFYPLIDGIDKTNLIGKIVSGCYNNIVSGPAAVIAFFVISGFCIHLPYSGGQAIPLTSYFSRRYVRILFPMAIAILLANPLKIKLSLFGSSILWSLLAEEIYYILYPLLLMVRKRYTWKRIVIAAYFLSVIVILSYPTAKEYASFGPSLNWAVGLPCWLLGCQLAESWRSIESYKITNTHIWSWRFTVWLFSSLCSVMRFHSPIGYPWSLNLFAIFVFFWLQREIAYYSGKQPVSLFEKGGKWSYSIYLVHLHGFALFSMLSIPYLGGVLSWIVRTTFILIACYIFYLVVERPSHSWARKLASNWIAGKKMVLAPQPDSLG